MRALLYLEDIHIGQRFATGETALDAQAIKDFARAFDPQPFHTDEHTAKDSFFAGLAASGWHTAALTMRLLVESGPALAGGMIGAAAELSWPRPTRPGDILHVESEVLAVTPSRSKPDRGLVILKSETRTRAGETVQVQTAKLLVWRRPL
jgi:acyl dehydratase